MVNNMKDSKNIKNVILKKDELLKQEGWKELRISWKECCKNPKYYISLAKQLFE